MEFYAKVKKDDIMKIASKWLELETIMLSEVTQFPLTKIMGNDVPHLWMLVPNPPIERKAEQNYCYISFYLKAVVMS